MRAFAAIALSALFLSGCLGPAGGDRRADSPNYAGSDDDSGSSIFAFGLKEAAGQKPSDIGDDSDSNFISRQGHR
jgi:hypothetical protein